MCSQNKHNLELKHQERTWLRWVPWLSPQNPVADCLPVAECLGGMRDEDRHEERERRVTKIENLFVQGDETCVCV
jgi:hypothetical protein